MKSNLDSSHLILFVYKRLRIFIIVGFASAVISSTVALLMEEKFQSSVVMFATTQSSIGQQFFEETNSGDILSYGETEDAERLLQEQLELLKEEKLKLKDQQKKLNISTDSDLDEKLTPRLETLEIDKTRKN